MASPFGCRSGHISAFAEATLPGVGRLARASALLLMHSQNSMTIEYCQLDCMQTMKTADAVARTSQRLGRARVYDQLPLR